MFSDFRIIFIFIIFNVFYLDAFSAVHVAEDQTAIGNGNGVSTPSFWQALNGHNPAGVVFNQTLKLQGSAAKFDPKTGVDSKAHQESIAILAGNGLIGMGAEWSKFDTLPTARGDSIGNWAVAGKLSPIHTIAGFSGHYNMPNGVGVYDAGLLFDLGYQLRIGAMAPDFLRGIKTAALGANYCVNRHLDVVLDGAYGVKNKTFVMKPGVGLHFDFFHFSAAYGIASSERPAVLLSRKFTGSVALRMASFLIAEYEYQGLTQHRVGLTLRWN